MNIFKIESQSSGFFAIINLTIKKELLSKMIKSLRISCIFFILISFLTFLLNCSQFKQNNPIASNGVIDLSTWNPNIESINLKGNCNEFYPVPAYWKFYNIPGKNLSPFGKATYRLILPTSFHDSSGIRWTEILSAFQIFINNKSVAQIGVLGMNGLQYHDSKTQTRQDRNWSTKQPNDDRHLGFEFQSSKSWFLATYLFR